MKIKRISTVLTGILMAATAVAATPNGPADDSQGLSRRGQLVHTIVLKWAPHVQETYQVSARYWAKEMGPLFKSASLDRLQDAANARTFQKMNDALLGEPSITSTASLSSADISPASIGDPDKDLVYTPVNPCRIIDTRLAGGKLNNNTSRDFDVSATSSYTGQGGSNTNCGIGDQGSFKAVVLSFTITGAEQTGFLKSYPVGAAQPGATTMTYLAGQLTSNSAIVPLDQTGLSNEMTVFVSGKTHIIADVVGFFDEPAITELECVEMPGTSVSRLNGGSVDAFGGHCPSTYTLVAGECNTVLSDSVVTDEDLSPPTGTAQGYDCQVSDLAPASGGTDTITAVSRCCRIPGA